jgi:autotransporter passenger strand-loop-strand repeat protein
MSGDLVQVQKGGVVQNLTVVAGSQLNVSDYGQAFNTTINGTEFVFSNGQQFTATVNNFGHLEVGRGGEITAATVNTGGVLIVDNAPAFATTLQGGTLMVPLNVFAQGVAHDVSFGAPAPGGGTHDNLVELGTPFQLTGTITGFQIGDVIDFVHTSVTNASAANGVLTVTYGPKAQTANYFLANQQPNTAFALQSDGFGGTDLILTPTPEQPPLQAPKLSSGEGIEQPPTEPVVLGKTGATDGAAIIGVQSLHETAGHQVLV